MCPAVPRIRSRTIWCDCTAPGAVDVPVIMLFCYPDFCPDPGRLRMLGAELSAPAYLARAAAELGRLDPAEMQALADAVEMAYLERRFVFVIGNGGSGANASHLCEDLGKCTLRREDFDND